MWAWAFAIDDQLRGLEPEIAKAVRTGDAAAPPTSVRLLLGFDKPVVEVHALVSLVTN